MNEAPNSPAPIPTDDDTAWPEHDDAQPINESDDRRKNDGAIEWDVAVTGAPD